jgi:hypothetical protein
VTNVRNRRGCGLRRQKPGPSGPGVVTTDYISQHRNPRFPFHKAETDRLIGQFSTDATVTDGVVRWNSNGRVPPQDILDFWAYLGFAFDVTKSKTVRDEETVLFLSDYRERMANHVSSAEELF